MRNSKGIVLSCCLLLMLTAGCLDRFTDDAALTARLQRLLDRKEYFKLADLLQKSSGLLSDRKARYFGAFVDNAFNRNDVCISAIDSLLSAPPSWLVDSARAALIVLRGDSYFKLFNYGKAARADSTLLDHFSGALSNDRREDVKNDLLIRNALRDVAPQQTIIRDSSAVPWKRDAIGLIEIPLTNAFGTFNAIFDTRANISSISRTYAEKLHLRLLNVSYREYAGITGIGFKTGLGIADSMYIGNALIRNAVFQVMPDSILYIAPIKTQLNIILGLPVIAQLREIQIYSSGRMVIPLHPGHSDLHNLALDRLDPVVSLITENDTLPFHFDSGAGTSILYGTYFETHKPEVLRKALLRTQSFGGAGGTQQKKTYILPVFRLTLSGKTVSIDSIGVFTAKLFPGERFYGNLGQDFMRQFNVFTINFGDMYIKGE